jgi:hypothetical protein
MNFIMSTIQQIPLAGSEVLAAVVMGEFYFLLLLFYRPPLWSSGQEFLATDPEVPGSIPGATRFSEK